MTDETTQAEPAALAETTAPESAVDAAQQEHDELSPEQQAEADEKANAEKSEEEKKRANERTKLRRRQRREAAERRLVEARIAAEREAAYWRGKAESTAQTSKDSDPSQPPRREDFEDYDAYLDARMEWKLQQRESKGEKPDAPHKEASDRRQTGDEKPQGPSYDPQVQKAFGEAGYEKYGDDFIEAVKDQHLPVTEVMGEAILYSDNGADVFMHLADNPEEAGRIAALSPYRQAKEIDKLSKQLQSGEEPNKQAEKTTASARPEGRSQAEMPQRKISKAPEPVKPEKGGSAPQVDLSKLSTQEYIERRRKQLFG